MDRLPAEDSQSESENGRATSGILNIWNSLLKVLISQTFPIWYLSAIGLYVETCDKGAFCEGWENIRYLIFQAWHYNAINIMN